ncbi:acetyl-CoA acetyltransferase [Enterococcus hirae]|uniref:acetyl-CoA acetyltransferase n=1 Tax=Enterococcus faecium TaxID=1352 RepID=UPI002EAFA563|nr:thiolase domain-containing protein [Enterococcus hirae]HAP8299423.1 thiolase domain-containing protein [Enterococcus faecium]
MGKVFVLGGAQTDFQRNWTKESKNVFALLSELMDDTLSECSLTYEQIQVLNEENRIAFFVGNFISELFIDQGHIGALLTEINPALAGIPVARYEAACASGSVAIDAAQAKISAGDYDVAIVLGFELMKTKNSKITGDILGRAAIYADEAYGIDFPFPKLFGRLADETIKKYHLDQEQYLNNLAKISVKNYENAKRNPNAQTRKWFMDYEQASHRSTDTNPSVGGLLAVSDCSQVTDGGASVVLVSENFLNENTDNFPIVLKGYGHRVAPMSFESKMNYAKDKEHILPWTKRAVEDAYKRANLGLEDIQVFETHDCFTSSEYAAISAFGITKPGEEYLAIEEGVTNFNGRYPINPSGGLIGCGHPVGATGVRMFLDIYKQVRGTAGNYQVSDVQNGLMLNIGGTATTNYVFIIGSDC